MAKVKTNWYVESMRGKVVECGKEFKGQGIGPPQKKSPSCRTDLSGRRGMYKRVGMGYSNPRLALIAGTRASAAAVAAL